MDGDIISYESMLAAKASADFAFYTLIVTVVSLIISLITLIFAKRALYTWKEQYTEDKKIKLIESLVKFNNTLISMPKSLSNDEDNVQRKTIIVVMSEVHTRCMVYLKDKPNDDLSENLRLLRDKFSGFLNGEAYKSELAVVVNMILMMNLT